MANLDFVTEIDENFNVSCHVLNEAEQCSDILNDQYSLKILTFNIRSLQKNFDDFTVVLQRLSVRFDIIILTECHLGTCNLIKTIPGYAHFWSSKICNQAGGVVAYIRSDWSANVTEPNIEDADSLMISLSNFYTIFAIYRSPSFSNIENFLISLHKVANEQISLNKRIIITGDVNIDTLDDDKDANDYLCLSAELGLKHMINVATRDTACLDHVVVDMRFQSVGLVCKASVTDHDIVMVGIKADTQTKRSKSIVTKADYDAIYDGLKYVDWSAIMQSDEVHIAAALLMEILENLIKQHTKNLKNRRKRYAIKPWMTPGLLKSMRHRDALHIHMRKNPKDGEAAAKYKCYRNNFLKLMRNLRNTYNKGKIIENRDNPRSLWKTIKNICELNRDKHEINELLNSKP